MEYIDTTAVDGDGIEYGAVDGESVDSVDTQNDSGGVPKWPLLLLLLLLSLGVGIGVAVQKRSTRPNGPPVDKGRREYTIGVLFKSYALGGERFGWDPTGEPTSAIDALIAYLPIPGKYHMSFKILATAHATHGAVQQLVDRLNIYYGEPPMDIIRDR